MYAPGQVVHDDTVKHVALCHSVYGLRPEVLAKAVLLRAAGHQVTAPGPVQRPVGRGRSTSDSRSATVSDRRRSRGA